MQHNDTILNVFLFELTLYAVHTQVVGSEGGGAYDIVVPCALPPKGYAIFSVVAAGHTAHTFK